MQLRPSTSAVWFGLLAVVAAGVLLVLRIDELAVALGLTGAAALAWLVLTAYVLTARVRVLANMIEVRGLRRRVAVPLDALDRTVRVTVGEEDRLHLRLVGGRHLATLGAWLWGSASVDMLAERLDAVSSAASEAAQLEREYPGSTSWAARHPRLVVGLAVPVLLALMVVAMLLVGG